MKESPKFQRPSLIKQFLEFVSLREVYPNDLCGNDGARDWMLEKRPDLYGDSWEIDTSLGGKCQSWRGMPRWWKSFLEEVER